MKVRQYLLNRTNESNDLDLFDGISLALIFAPRNMIENYEWISALKSKYPEKSFVSVSSAGEISNSGISDDTIILTDIIFEKSEFRIVSGNIAEFDSSKEMGTAIINQLNTDNLNSVILFSDGQEINGDDLVDGIKEYGGEDMKLIGGLAGDGINFHMTLVGIDDNIKIGNVVAIGLYGNDIYMSCAARGGWWQFGPIKKVTKSQNNILYEINGEPALEIYKKYLGADAANLPGSALLYPLCIVNDSHEVEVVRTILNIDEKANSMIFAGNIPEGSDVKLMRASIDDLSQASYDIANLIASDIKYNLESQSLTLAISCVGRKLVYNDRADDEWYSIKKWLPDSVCAGFFSYGEISTIGKEFLFLNQSLSLGNISEL